ncbi:hypothetical protein HKCCSP123_06185 [Rhodobacterales bacterium HKCCSP123]|nr:hypothetical protein [Rhodobacterales bacterium HKCCSP123]
MESIMEKAGLADIDETRRFLGGRSRSTLMRDVATGAVPAPIRMGNGPKAKLYWNRAALHEHVERLFSEEPQGAA